MSSYKKIELPAAYKPEGGKHRKGRSKGYNKVKYLWDSGLRDWMAIRLMVVNHYYALLDERGIRGKRRSNYIKSRKHALLKAIKEAKRVVIHF